MRVLHLPSHVGGNAWHLSRAERANGIESDVFYLKDDIYFKHKSDIENSFLTGNKVFDFPKMIKFCRSIVDEYDIFHFNFGQSLFTSSRFGFLDLIDLPYYKKRGKVLAVTFQGDDARQADYCIKHHKINYFSEISKEEREARIRISDWQRQRIKKFSKYVDLMYTTNPDLMPVLSDKAKFRPYTKINIEDYKPHYSDYENSQRKFIITHAPSNRNVKGTRYVEEAVSRLVEEGFDVELKLVEGMSNIEALKLYQDADVVVDQLLVGWYGGLAVECMAFGKPVMCYIRDSDLIYIPPEMKADLPIINVNEDTLYVSIKHYLLNRSELSSIAASSRRYVEKWHENSSIAKSIINDYNKCMEVKT